MKPNDLLRQGDRFWQVKGILLGALNQESVIEVTALGIGAPCTDSPILIPEIILRKSILTGLITHYTRVP